MIRNYIKIAWRNLVKNKAHSFINILGLSVGLACSLLIMLWVQNELAVDSFHKNGKLLYNVYERQYNDNKVTGQYNTPGLLAEEIKKQIPEIQYATSSRIPRNETFQLGDKVLKMQGTYVGLDYLKMFSYPLLQGNIKIALVSPDGIAISRKMASIFFGSPQAAMGKMVRLNNKRNFNVSAVFEDVPDNSQVQFDYLINWDVFLKNNSWAKNWDNNGPLTSLMLRPDANPALVEKKITHFLDSYNKNKKQGTFTIELGMQRYSEQYLHGNFGKNGFIDGGRIEYVGLFSIVAIFILLIACINFMNLTTARSIKRAHEIGVRKVVGALRSSLIGQFIGESLMLTTLAVILSLVFITALLPLFNNITLKHIVLPFNQVSFWFALVLITLITGIVAGSYPALFLSSFNPVKVLKGALKLSWGAVYFRKGLVVFQFVLSVILITGTIVVARQINYIQTKNLGYDRENLIYMPLEGEMAKQYAIFKSEALNMPGIKAITRMGTTPTDLDNTTIGVNWEGKDPNLNVSFSQAYIGYDFTKAMQLKFVAGRDFSKNFATDSAGYIINEAALKRMGYKNPIGRSFTFWDKKGTIIGVLKDFHYQSIHEEIKPMIFYLDDKESYGDALIRTEAGKTKEALASIQKLWKELNPNFPFTYSFSDEEYQKLYQNEQVIGKLSSAFAFLAIFISCLGLLGLAMFTAEQRFKEIGIRKVLGASVASLFTLLSGEFLVLVFISLIIASPLAWYGMNKWLENFAYHAPIQWWMFALSAIIALLITLITVSFQSIKAALINPVKSLRSE